MCQAGLPLHSCLCYCAAKDLVDWTSADLQAFCSEHNWPKLCCTGAELLRDVKHWRNFILSVGRACRLDADRFLAELSAHSATSDLIEDPGTCLFLFMHHFGDELAANTSIVAEIVDTTLLFDKNWSSDQVKEYSKSAFKDKGFEELQAYAVNGNYAWPTGAEVVTGATHFGMRLWQKIKLANVKGILTPYLVTYSWVTTVVQVASMPWYTKLATAVSAVAANVPMKSHLERMGESYICDMKLVRELGLREKEFAVLVAAEETVLKQWNATEPMKVDPADEHILAAIQSLLARRTAKKSGMYCCKSVLECCIFSSII